MLRDLLDEDVIRLMQSGKPWKWCTHCKHKGKKVYRLATIICTNCDSVYCEECGDICFCQSCD